MKFEQKDCFFYQILIPLALLLARIFIKLKTANGIVRYLPVQDKSYIFCAGNIMVFFLSCGVLRKISHVRYSLAENQGGYNIISFNMTGMAIPAFWFPGFLKN